MLFSYATATGSYFENTLHKEFQTGRDVILSTQRISGSGIRFYLHKEEVDAILKKIFPYVKRALRWTDGRDLKDIYMFGSSFALPSDHGVNPRGVR